MTLANRLAAYCADLTFEALPGDVVAAAKMKILDSLCCAFAALESETTKVLFLSGEHYSPAGPVCVWGAGRRASALDAAFINATQAHALLHDDTDLESGHVACMVVPALLAAAQAEHASHPVDGRDMIAAVVAGYEVMWRGSGRGAVVKGALERSFRGFVVNGALAAAAAAARMLRLDAACHAGAISCAANAVSGLLEPVGAASIERAIMAGNNSRTGLHAAFLAASGLRGTASILEGAQGYFEAVAGSTGFATEFLTEGLGQSHRILDTLYKKYPSAGANQSAIYAAEVMHQRHRPDPDAISAIRVWQYTMFGRGVEKADGTPAYPAIVSTGPYGNLEEVLPNKPFGISAMLLYGKYDAPIIERGLNDPALVQIARKVTSDGNDEFGPLDAAIEINMKSGEVLYERVNCVDEAQFFPTLGTMAARFEVMAGRYLTRVSIDELIASVEALERPGGAARLFEVLDGLGELRPKPGNRKDNVS